MTWNYFNRSKIDQDDIVCETAGLFLEALVSLPRSFKEHNKHNWSAFIYRGQSDSRWDLVPSALRDTRSARRELKLLHDGIVGITFEEGEKDQEYIQRESEYLVLKTFYQHVEKAGLPLPPVDPEVHEELMHPDESGPIKRSAFPFDSRYNCWPPKCSFELFGLAQHYGLPTRLLDWSYSAMTAAYFGAVKAIETLEYSEPSDEHCICVWAAHEGQFRGQKTLHGDTLIPMDDEYQYPIRTIKIPSAGNPNLRKQQGLFTVALDRRKINIESPTDRVGINRIVEGPKGEGRFYRLLLPIKLAPQLLFLIHQQGYSANRLYDGYEGAAKATVEFASLGERIFRSSENTPEAIIDPIGINWNK